MTEHDYAQKAARLLAEQRNDLPLPLGSAAADLSHVSAMTQAMAARAGQRRSSRRLVAAAAVLALAAGVTLWWSMRTEAPRLAVVGSPQAQPAPLLPGIAVKLVDGQVALQSNAGSAPLQSNTLLLAGQRLKTAAQGATLALATGTRFTMMPHTDLAVLEMTASQRLLVLSGESRFRVAKLAPGEHFVVSTQDAEVEVEGTVFSVQVMGFAERCLQARTVVKVDEGQVAVRHAGVSYALTPGQAWPPACEPRAPAASAPLRVARHDRVPPVSVPQPPVVAVAVEIPPPPSEAPPDVRLKEQNDLFAHAAAMHKQGNAVAAAAQLEVLLTRFGDSPLAEAACAKRMQWLAEAQSAQAKPAAQTYLQRYPSGFARTQAQRILEAK